MNIRIFKPCHYFFNVISCRNFLKLAEIVLLCYNLIKIEKERKGRTMYVTNPDLEPASDAQLELIAKLIKTREVQLNLVTDMRSMWRKGLMTMAVASQLITLLKCCPEKKNIVNKPDTSLVGIHLYKGKQYQVVLSSNGILYSNLLHKKNGKTIKEYYPEAMKYLNKNTLITGKVISNAELPYYFDDLEEEDCAYGCFPDYN